MLEAIFSDSIANAHRKLVKEVLIFRQLQIKLQFTVRLLPFTREQLAVAKLSIRIRSILDKQPPRTLRYAVPSAMR